MVNIHSYIYCMSTVYMFGAAMRIQMMDEREMILILKECTFQTTLFLNLLIKTQVNVHRRQFPLYKILPHPYSLSQKRNRSNPFNWLKTLVTILMEISIWNSFSAALLGVSFSLTLSLFPKWPGKEKKRHCYIGQKTHSARWR